ncbi:MAG: hypothetical protein IV090_17845 [Candidatus Sericytochromatia bacterium]|nr:hypothetical protein [Candidatus Sericytochromatia bacterium]
MAHCPEDKLTDLTALFAELRSWPGLKEKKTGIFYFKGKGFLHFHIKDGKRWADIREGNYWGSPLDLPFEPTPQYLDAFVTEVKRRFLLTGAQST